MRYADALKEMAALLLDVPVESFEDRTFKEKHRKFLQRLGTEVFRKQVHEHFWVNKVVNRILGSGANLIVIPDTRFPNEIDVLANLLALNATVLPVRVHRPGVTCNPEHESETALNQYRNWWYQTYPSEGKEHVKREALYILNRLRWAKQ